MRCSTEDIAHEVQDAACVLQVRYVICRGTLPPWSVFPELQLLDVSANSVTGSLPPDYADLKQLQTLLLSANQLNGCAQSIFMFYMYG